MLNRTLASLLFATSACAASPIALAQSGSVQLATSQQPIPAEKNPPGDIPDNQAFVLFKSPMGFSVKVPEGWARRDEPGGVRFSDKYNAVQVMVVPQAAVPTRASLKANQIARLEKSPMAIRVNAITPVTLPSGAGFDVTYGANSDPNAVTNKAIRLDNARYYLWKSGKLATLTLSAPAGTDNVDQWRLMANSFTWTPTKP